MSVLLISFVDGSAGHHVYCDQVLRLVDCLEDHVGYAVIWQLVVEYIIFLTLRHHRVRVPLLTDFTLDDRPLVGLRALLLPRLLFGVQPLTQAVQMDQVHRASALAGVDEGVRIGDGVTPADAADKEGLVR